MNDGKEEGTQEIMSGAMVEGAVVRSCQFIFSLSFFKAIAVVYSRLGPRLSRSFIQKDDE
jgi:hypothetical protein